MPRTSRTPILVTLPRWSTPRGMRRLVLAARGVAASAVLACRRAGDRTCRQAGPLRRHPPDPEVGGRRHLLHRGPARPHLRRRTRSSTATTTARTTSSVTRSPTATTARATPTRATTRSTSSAVVGDDDPDDRVLLHRRAALPLLRAARGARVQARRRRVLLRRRAAARVRRRPPGDDEDQRGVPAAGLRAPGRSRSMRRSAGSARAPSSSVPARWSSSMARAVLRSSAPRAGVSVDACIPTPSLHVDVGIGVPGVIVHERRR